MCIILSIIYCNTDKAKSFEKRWSHDEGYSSSMIGHIIERRKHFLDLILRAIDFYGKSKELYERDRKVKIISKLEKYKKSPVEQSDEHDKVLIYFFPELFYNKSIPILTNNNIQKDSK